mmetsp:Transcript_51761/g.136861  ORF Transcript_51761/g.136861 Transcript_51761/m.136861 type:complete len:275 (-) Transcript_51761:256-1080(-)
MNVVSRARDQSTSPSVWTTIAVVTLYSTRPRPLHGWNEGHSICKEWSVTSVTLTFATSSALLGTGGAGGGSITSVPDDSSDQGDQRYSVPTRTWNLDTEPVATSLCRHLNFPWSGSTSRGTPVVQSERSNNLLSTADGFTGFTTLLLTCILVGFTSWVSALDGAQVSVTAAAKKSPCGVTSTDGTVGASSCVATGAVVMENQFAMYLSCTSIVLLVSRHWTKRCSIPCTRTFSYPGSHSRGKIFSGSIHSCSLTASMAAASGATPSTFGNSISF